MDMIRTAKEIGLFEAGINLSKVCNSDDVCSKAGAFMPLPDKNIADEVPRIAAWLHDFGKRKYLFLTPEIALIEALAELSDGAEAIIALPGNLSPDAKERIQNNLPRKMHVSSISETFFPQRFFPADSMIVVCGYSAGGRAMVLSETYRMVEHYSGQRGFHGKWAFIPYKELDVAVRYDGWMEVGAQRLSTAWSSSETN